MKDGNLQFKSQADCDKFFAKAQKASRMAQGKSKASGATTDREKRLQAKIKRLERQNEGLAKRIVELRENYDCLLDAYKSLKDAMFYKPNVIKYHK